MNNSSSTIPAEKIAERAYALWESEGCPEGSDTDHWLRAERELQETETRATKTTGSSEQLRPPTAARAKRSAKEPTRVGAAVSAH